MTLGSLGVIAYTKIHNEIIKYECSAYIIEPILDLTGAGDAFTAGFLINWCHNKDINKALKAGCFCGANAIQSFGGSNTNIELLSRLALKLEFQD